MNAPLTLIDQSFVIAADHGGFGLKEHLLGFFKARGITHYTDIGVFTAERADFPEQAGALVKLIQAGAAQCGILICGSGIGMSIAANRHTGIYAALCHDTTTARLAREHNNANVLALGGRLLGPTLAEEIVQTFMTTPFAGGRYQERIGLIDPAADPLLNC